LFYRLFHPARLAHSSTELHRQHHVSAVPGRRCGASNSWQKSFRRRGDVEVFTYRGAVYVQGPPRVLLGHAGGRMRQTLEASMCARACNLGPQRARPEEKREGCERTLQHYSSSLPSLPSESGALATPLGGGALPGSSELHIPGKVPPAPHRQRARVGHHNQEQRSMAAREHAARLTPQHRFFWRPNTLSRA
jgi:hypothetical protein